LITKIVEAESDWQEAAVDLRQVEKEVDSEEDLRQVETEVDYEDNLCQGEIRDDYEEELRQVESRDRGRLRRRRKKYGVTDN
jgi:uncharacterized protein YajQ (UPF0234 family)